MESLSTAMATAKAKMEPEIDTNYTEANVAVNTPGSNGMGEEEEIEAAWSGLWERGGGIRGKRKPGEFPRPFIMHSAYTAFSASSSNATKSTTGRLQEPSPGPTPSPPIGPAPKLKDLAQSPDIGFKFLSHDPDPLTKRARSICWNYPTPRSDSPYPNDPNGLQLRLPPLISFPINLPTPTITPPPTPNPPHTHRSIYTQLADFYTRNLIPANDFLGAQDPDTNSSYRLCDFTQDPSPSAEWDRQYLYFILRLQERGINCHSQYPVPIKPYLDLLPDSVPIDLRVPPGFWAHQSIPGGHRKRCFGFVSGQMLGRGWWSWIMTGYLCVNGVERMQIFELPAGGQIRKYSDLTSAAKGIAEGKPGVSGWECTIMPSWERENMWAVMRRAAVGLQAEKRKWEGKEGDEAAAARERLGQLELQMQMDGQDRKRQAQAQSPLPPPQPPPQPPSQPHKGFIDARFDPPWSLDDEPKDLSVLRDSIQGNQLSEEEEEELQPSLVMPKANALAVEEWLNVKMVLLEREVVGRMQVGGGAVRGGHIAKRGVTSKARGRGRGRGGISNKGVVDRSGGTFHFERFEI